MSYDIYCYKSELGKPDVEEANAMMEIDPLELDDAKKDPATRQAIVKALTAYNPRLKAFDFDYEELASFTNTSVEAVKAQFDHVELNTPEGDLPVQITVYGNQVGITIPYWRAGVEGGQLANNIRAYIRIIHETAGYFVNDPQTGEVFDPSENNYAILDNYLSANTTTEEATVSEAYNAYMEAQQKPWWKFW